MVNDQQNNNSAIQYMISEDYVSLAAVLNNEEIQCASDLHQWPAALHMLALIFTGDLEDARMLHKRLPEEQKKDSPVQMVLALLQVLWHKQYEVTYQVLQQTQWPDEMRPLIRAVEQSFRGKMVDLVSKAYSQIRIEKGTALLGLPSEQIIQEAPGFGWAWNPGTRIFTVQKKSRQKSMPSNHTQIQRLTQYVAHLED